MCGLAYGGKAESEEGSMSSWIEERVKMFVPLIAPLGVPDEAALEQACAQEIEAWRARGLAQASLNSPMTAMRTAIKQLPLTEENAWVNPRTQEREHLALKYMNFSKEEWDRIKASTTKRVFERMEQQHFLNEPEDVVRRITMLLEQDSWPALTVGVLGASGRRLSEGLVTAQFGRETDYTVIFTGQLKQPVADLAYEIPLLVPADLFLPAVERLRQHRELQDLPTLTLNAVAHRYGPKVREAAREAFGDIVPARAGHHQLTVHDLRAAYARIAVHWYCPPEKSDRLYAATILGHIQGATSEEEALARMATEEHYTDYLIGDGTGNQNGAKGIKLGEPGVVVLKAFQPAPVPALESASLQQERTTPMKRKTKRGATRRSLLNVMPEVRERVLARKQPGMTENEALVVALDLAEVAERGMGQLTPEQLGFTLQEAQEIRRAMELSAEMDFLVFVRKALPKEARIRIGMAQRNQGMEEAKLMRLSTSELERLPKSAEVTQERIRRAVLTIMHYNQQQPDPRLRAAITQNAVHELIGGRFEHIRQFLELHQQAIARHHEAGEIPEKRSAKVDLRVLVIADEAEAFATGELSETIAQAESKAQIPQEEAVSAANER
jgi:hypothetical protein